MKLMVKCLIVTFDVFVMRACDFGA